LAPATADGCRIHKVVNGFETLMASEAVDLEDRVSQLTKLQVVGTTIKGFRGDLTTPKTTVTDTAHARGRWGFEWWGGDTGAGYGGATIPPSSIKFVATASPDPEVLRYFEAPVVGSGKPGDPFRIELAEEIAWEWSLNPALKRKYNILRRRGFTEVEILDLFPAIQMCRVNRLALTYSAFIKTDPAKPREYIAIVKIFEQPDRQPHLRPIPDAIDAFKKMRGVKRLSAEEAVRKAKKLDDKLISDTI